MLERGEQKPVSSKDQEDGDDYEQYHQYVSRIHDPATYDIVFPHHLSNTQANQCLQDWQQFTKTNKLYPKSIRCEKRIYNNSCYFDTQQIQNNNKKQQVKQKSQKKQQNFKDAIKLQKEQASEGFIKMLNDLYKREGSNDIKKESWSSSPYLSTFQSYSKLINSMNQMEVILQALNQNADSHNIRENDETEAMAKISLSKRMIKQLQQSEIMQFGDSIKVSDDQSQFDQSKYLELLKRIKFHELCVQHVKGKSNKQNQLSTESDSYNSQNRPLDIENLHKILIQSEQVQSSIKQRKKIGKIIKKGKQLSPDNPSLINLNALKTAIEMEEKILERLRKRKRLNDYRFLESQVPNRKNLKVKQVHYDIGSYNENLQSLPYFISNALLSKYQKNSQQNFQVKEQLMVAAGQQSKTEQSSSKRNKDQIQEETKRQNKIKLITSLCMNTYSRKKEEYFNSEKINSLLKRRPAQLKSSEFMELYRSNNTGGSSGKNKRADQIEIKGGIQLGYTKEDFFKLPQYNPSLSEILITNVQQQQQQQQQLSQQQQQQSQQQQQLQSSSSSSTLINNIPLDQTTCRNLPHLSANYAKFQFPDGVNQNKYFSANGLSMDGKISSQLRGKINQGGGAGVVGVGDGTNGDKGSDNWTYSFIQNSTRDHLLSVLTEQMKRQSQKLNQIRDEKEDTVSNIGGGGSGVGGINNQVAVRSKQQQPVITVGGVKLDKIVMKVNVISKSAKKTSKMLRGAQIKKGKFKLLDNGLAVADDQQLKKYTAMVYKREIFKMMKYYLKYKTDKESFCKRMVTNCAKQFRKKAVKRVKAFKEYSQRAKKLAKQVQQFWKRQDRQLVDAKRKKQKYIKEIKRQEQERKEAQLQEKRFKFLLRQSTVYADFMARKMGVQTHHDIEQTKLDSLEQEKRAKFEVSAMINQHKERIASYDNKSADLISPEDLLEDQNKQNQQNQQNLLDGGNAGAVILRPPRFFQGMLKEYQLKGLSWLVNLYEQGINGILADQMGLGKTVQAISLLAHICDTKNEWGPFLVCAPTTTLHSWLQQVKKFCPALQVMPYWGSQPQRKTFRQYFRPRSLGQRDSIFHILVTSYQLAVSDQKYLQRIKWKYIVLDQAQAIKNFLSVRWKTLLNYDSRNRLLLTGTPIQNSMAQLWALLHFIMPALFSKHDDFQQWFSKDIQAHSRNQGTIDNAQLQKLHAVLKPFMLRRVKKDVEHQLPPKQQFDLLCQMSSRQKKLYKMVKQKVPLSEMFQMAESKFKLQNLMNLIMQFRKVCNHPELFERHFGISPYMFKVNTPFVPLPSVYNFISGVTQIPFMKLTLTNPIFFYVPKIIIQDLNMADYVSSDRGLLNLNGYYQKSLSGGEGYVKKLDIGIRKAIYQRFSIFDQVDDQILEDQSNQDSQALKKKSPCFAQTLAYFMGLTFCQLRYVMRYAPWIAIQIGFNHYYHNIAKKAWIQRYNDDQDRTFIRATKFNCINYYKESLIKSRLSIFDALNILLTQYSIHYNTRSKVSIEQRNQLNECDPNLITISHSIAHLQRLANLRNQKFSYFPRALAAPIFPISESIKYKSSIQFYFKQNPITKRCLNGNSLIVVGRNQLSHVGYLQLNFKSTFMPFKKPTQLQADNYNNSNTYIPYKIYQNICDYNRELFPNTIQQYMYPLDLPKSFSKYELPDFNRLVQDSGKLKLLDDLLKKLYFENHRTLIFCQMTKMLDILQEFLTWRKYTYLRMDGSSVVSDRRDMVDQFQRNQSIFAFLLSTRAGGLGVTLTAADTVIFYDSDWNPTMDAQATDRVHRIGQTKEVKVYRLMTKGTVEERIIKRAQQKQTVQSTVYAGGALKGELFKTTEVVGLLMDDDEMANEAAELQEMSKLTNQSMSYSNKQQLMQNTQ